MGLPRNQVTHLDELADVIVSAAEPATRTNGDGLQDDDKWLDVGVSPPLWKLYDSSVPEWVTVGSDGTTVDGSVDLVGVRVAPTAPNDASIWLPLPASTLTVSSDAADREVVLAPSSAWEQTAIQEPNVWYDPDAGLFAMVYSGGWDTQSLGYATARHPLGPWTRHPDPILGNGVGGEDGGPWVGRPNVFVDDDGQVYVYYSAQLTGTGGDLFVATGDLPTLTKQGTALSATATATAMQNTSVVRLGDTYHMIFESLASSGAQWQMGYATASDPLGPFTIQQFPLPTLQRGTGMYGGPFLTCEDGTWVLIYHAATSGSLPTEIYRATSTDLLSWTQDAGTLVTRVVDPPEHDQVADPHVLWSPVGAFMFWDAVNNTTEAASLMGSQLAGVGEPQWTDGTAWYPFTSGVTRNGWTLVESASQIDFDSATDAGAILAVYRWGVDGSGSPYFDSAGVTSGEEAALWLDDAGNYVLVELDL